MDFEYKYKVIRENIVTGEHIGKSKIITKYKPLKVGGLYLYLGRGYKGTWRVLEFVSKTKIED